MQRSGFASEKQAAAGMAVQPGTACRLARLPVDPPALPASRAPEPPTLNSRNRRKILVWEE